METLRDTLEEELADFSLLAREINWMETMLVIFRLKYPIISLLAREINWMETYLLTNSKNQT